MRLLALLLACVSPALAGDESPLRVYVGTYTEAGSKGIYLLELDRTTGALASKGVVAETPNPSFLALHPDGKSLYAVAEVGEFEGKKAGAVAAFAVDRETGKLSPLNKQSSGGSGPCYLVVDRSGKAVLVANYGGGSVAALPIAEGGNLDPASSFRQHEGQGADPSRQEGPHAHSINLDAANRFAVAADLGLDRLFVYRWDSAKGTLTPNDPPSLALPAGGGPRHFAFHPDGRHAFVCLEMTSQVVPFDYDPERGTFRAGEPLSTLPEGADKKGNSTAEVVVHPGGKFVYVSNRGHDSIAIFRAQCPDRPTEARRPPADRREDSAQLRDRPFRQVPAGRQPGFGDDPRFPHRPAIGPSQSHGPLGRGPEAGLPEDDTPGLKPTRPGLRPWSSAPDSLGYASSKC